MVQSHMSSFAWLVQLFETLRNLALMKGILVCGDDGKFTIKDEMKEMTYEYLGVPVCRKAFAILLGVGWHP